MNIALELHNGLATGILLGGTALSKYGSECSLKKIKRKKKERKNVKRFKSRVISFPITTTTHTQTVPQMSSTK